MVSMTDAVSVAFALFNLQERGTLFVAPGVEVYEGMIVGENARAGDMDVNVGKGKKLTNIRAAGADEKIILEPPRELTLEAALEFIAEDELVEVDARGHPAAQAPSEGARAQEGLPPRRLNGPRARPARERRVEGRKNP